MLTCGKCGETNNNVHEKIFRSVYIICAKCAKNIKMMDIVNKKMVCDGDIKSLQSWGSKYFCDRNTTYTFDESYYMFPRVQHCSECFKYHYNN